MECEPPTKIARTESNYSIFQTYLFDGTLYNIIQINETEKNPKIKAQCSHCPKIISGTQTSTGNFLSHLKKVHPHLQKLVNDLRVQYRQHLTNRKLPNTLEPSTTPNPALIQLFPSHSLTQKEELQGTIINNDINTSADATTSTAPLQEVNATGSPNIPKKCQQRRLLDNTDTDIMRQTIQLFQSSTSSMNDPYFTYALNMAHELRKYDSHTLAHVKHAIASVLFEADMGRIESYSHSSLYVKNIHSPQVCVSSTETYNVQNQSSVPSDDNCEQHRTSFSTIGNLHDQHSLDNSDFQVKTEPSVILHKNNEFTV